MSRRLNDTQRLNRVLDFLEKNEKVKFKDEEEIEKFFSGKIEGLDPSEFWFINSHVLIYENLPIVYYNKTTGELEILQGLNIRRDGEEFKFAFVVRIVGDNKSRGKIAGLLFEDVAFGIEGKRSFGLYTFDELPKEKKELIDCTISKELKDISTGDYVGNFSFTEESTIGAYTVSGAQPFIFGKVEDVNQTFKTLQVEVVIMNGVVLEKANRISLTIKNSSIFSVLKKSSEYRQPLLTKYVTSIVIENWKGDEKDKPKLSDKIRLYVGANKESFLLQRFNSNAKSWDTLVNFDEFEYSDKSSIPDPWLRLIFFSEEKLKLWPYFFNTSQVVGREKVFTKDNAKLVIILSRMQLQIEEHKKLETSGLELASPIKNNLIIAFTFYNAVYRGNVELYPESGISTPKPKSTTKPATPPEPPKQKEIIVIYESSQGSVDIIESIESKDTIKSTLSTSISSSSQLETSQKGGIDPPKLKKNRVEELGRKQSYIDQEEALIKNNYVRRPQNEDIIRKFLEKKSKILASFISNISKKGGFSYSIRDTEAFKKIKDNLYKESADGMLYVDVDKLKKYEKLYSYSIIKDALNIMQKILTTFSGCLQGKKPNGMYLYTGEKYGYQTKKIEDSTLLDHFQYSLDYFDYVGLVFINNIIYLGETRDINIPDMKPEKSSQFEFSVQKQIETYFETFFKPIRRANASYKKNEEYYASQTLYYDTISDRSEFTLYVWDIFIPGEMDRLPDEFTKMFSVLLEGANSNIDNKIEFDLRGPTVIPESKEEIAKYNKLISAYQKYAEFIFKFFDIFIRENVYPWNVMLVYKVGDIIEKYKTAGSPYFDESKYGDIKTEGENFLNYNMKAEDFRIIVESLEAKDELKLTTEVIGFDKDQRSKKIDVANLDAEEFKKFQLAIESYRYAFGKYQKKNYGLWETYLTICKVYYRNTRNKEFSDNFSKPLGDFLYPSKYYPSFLAIKAKEALLRITSFISYINGLNSKFILPNVTQTEERKKKEKEEERKRKEKEEEERKRKEKEKEQEEKERKRREEEEKKIDEDIKRQIEERQKNVEREISDEKDEETRKNTQKVDLEDEIEKLENNIKKYKEQKSEAEQQLEEFEKQEGIAEAAIQGAKEDIIRAEKRIKDAEEKINDKARQLESIVKEEQDERDTETLRREKEEKADKFLFETYAPKSLRSKIETLKLTPPQTEADKAKKNLLETSKILEREVEIEKDVDKRNAILKNIVENINNEIELLDEDTKVKELERLLKNRDSFFESYREKSFAYKEDVDLLTYISMVELQDILNVDDKVYKEYQIDRAAAKYFALNFNNFSSILSYLRSMYIEYGYLRKTDTKSLSDKGTQDYIKEASEFLADYMYYVAYYDKYTTKAIFDMIKGVKIYQLDIDRTGAGREEIRPNYNDVLTSINDKDTLVFKDEKEKETIELLEIIVNQARVGIKENRLDDAIKELKKRLGEPDVIDVPEIKTIEEPSARITVGPIKTVLDRDKLSEEYLRLVEILNRNEITEREQERIRKRVEELIKQIMNFEEFRPEDAFLAVYNYPLFQEIDLTQDTIQETKSVLDINGFINTLSSVFSSFSLQIRNVKYWFNSDKVFSTNIELFYDKSKRDVSLSYIVSKNVRKYIDKSDTSYKGIKSLERFRSYNYLTVDQSDVILIKPKNKVDNINKKTVVYKLNNPSKLITKENERIPLEILMLYYENSTLFTRMIFSIVSKQKRNKVQM